MDGYLNVVHKRLDSLIQITITERKDKGIGCLFLNFTKENHLDCSYITIGSEHFPTYLEDYKERMISVPPSIIFLYIFDESDYKILEIDLDKNNNK